jgi:hypothetical protein
MCGRDPKIGYAGLSVLQGIARLPLVPFQKPVQGRRFKWLICLSWRPREGSFQNHLVLEK